MNSDQISLLALVTSMVSLGVSFITLYRDRHVISVRAVPVEHTKGVFHLYVTVSNSGKRPVSINHVLLRPPGKPLKPGLFINFAPDGQNRIDVGESRTCQISPVGLPIAWTTADELRTFNIYVQDAVGKQHKAAWEGKSQR